MPAGTRQEGAAEPRAGGCGGGSLDGANVTTSRTATGRNKAGAVLFMSAFR